MNIPEDLRYSKDHEWVRLEGNVATVGITDHAQGELGDLVYVEIDTLGEYVDMGEVFGTVEAVKTTSDLYMPLSGKVIEFNDRLSEEGEDNPALINEEPYGQGWIIKVDVQDMDEYQTLLTAEEYKDLID